MRPILTCTVAACLAVATGARVPSAQRDLARPHLMPGITYVIDTTVITRSTYDPSRPDAAAGSYRAFQSYIARVVYANGRGRLDVQWVRPGPSVSVDSATLTTPLARPGDYYLFDSTGFVLVRPATRTFSRATITHEHYGTYDDREGWPAFFEFQPPRLDTATRAPDPAMSQPGPLNIYWHTDAGRAGFARGRTAIANAPFREMNIARWFGATRWLAHIADSARAIPNEVVVTAAIPFRPPNEKGVPRTFILKQAFTRPTIEDIDPSSLVLPGGFTEVRWPGSER